MSKKNYLEFLFLVMIMGCANSYKLEKKSKLIFSESYFNNWYSPVEGGGSGFSVYVILDVESLDESIKVEGIFFKGKYAILNPQNPGKYQTFIKENSNSNILENEKRNEETDKFKEKGIPFSLNENEAVISYLDNNVEKYFKIVLVKKKTMDFPM